MCKHLQDRNERLADGVADHDHGVSFNDLDFSTGSMMADPNELNKNFSALSGTALQPQDGRVSSMMLQTPLREARGQALADL